MLTERIAELQEWIAKLINRRSELERVNQSIDEIVDDLNKIPNCEPVIEWAFLGKQDIAQAIKDITGTIEINVGDLRPLLEVESERNAAELAEKNRQHRHAVYFK